MFQTIRPARCRSNLENMSLVLLDQLVARTQQIATGYSGSEVYSVAWVSKMMGKLLIAHLVLVGADRNAKEELSGRSRRDENSETPREHLSCSGSERDRLPCGNLGVPWRPSCG